MQGKKLIETEEEFMQYTDAIANVDDDKRELFISYLLGADPAEMTDPPQLLYIPS